jgi:ribosomal subunit interface protein
MQVYIEGQHTEIQPELRTMITTLLEELNAQHDDIIHARVALDKDTHYQRGNDEVRITLSLPGKMLTAKKTATSLYDAANAATSGADSSRGPVHASEAAFSGSFEIGDMGSPKPRRIKRSTSTPTLCTASLLRRSKWVWPWIWRSRPARRGYKPLESLHTCPQFHDGAGALPCRGMASGGEGRLSLRGRNA